MPHESTLERDGTLISEPISSTALFQKTTLPGPKASELFEYRGKIYRRFADGRVEIERRIGKVEAIKRDLMIAVGLIPIVGTAVHWNNMSNRWKVVSILGDLLFVAPAIKAVGVVGITSAKALALSGETFAESYRLVSALGRESAAYRAFLKTATELGDPVLIREAKAFHSARNEYAETLIKIKRAEKIRNDLKSAIELGETRTSGGRESLTLALKNAEVDFIEANRIAEGAQASLQKAGVEYVESIKSYNFKGFASASDDPRLAEEFKFFPKRAVSNVEDFVGDLFVPKPHEIEGELAAAKKALSEAKNNFPTDPSAWLDKIQEVSHLEGRLALSSKMDNLSTLSKEVLQVKDEIIRTKNSISQVVNAGTRESLKIHLDSLVRDEARVSGKLAQAYRNTTQIIAEGSDDIWRLGGGVEPPKKPIVPKVILSKLASDGGSTGPLPLGRVPGGPAAEGATGTALLTRQVVSPVREAAVSSRRPPFAPLIVSTPTQGETALSVQRTSFTEAIQATTLPATFPTRIPLLPAETTPRPVKVPTAVPTREVPDEVPLPGIREEGEPRPGERVLPSISPFEDPETVVSPIEVPETEIVVDPSPEVGPIPEIAPETKVPAEEVIIKPTEVPEIVDIPSTPPPGPQPKVKEVVKTKVEEVVELEQDPFEEDLPAVEVDPITGIKIETIAIEDVKLEDLTEPKIPSIIRIGTPPEIPTRVRVQRGRPRKLPRFGLGVQEIRSTPRAGIRRRFITWPQGPIWVEIWWPFTEEEINYTRTPSALATKVRNAREAYNRLRAFGDDIAIDTFDEWASWFPGNL